MFVLYNNLAQFMGSGSDESYYVNSRILSASIDIAGRKRNLTTPVIIVLQHLKVGLIHRSEICVCFSEVCRLKMCMICPDKVRQSGVNGETSFHTTFRFQDVFLFCHNNFVAKF